MNKIALVICIAVLATAFNSCEKKTGSVDVNFGKDYYPIETGRSITYKVDSTIYDDFTGKIFTSTSFLKDVVDTSFMDLQNHKSWYVKRYYRPDSVANYTLAYQYIVTPYSNRVEVLYDNLRYIKLVFPVTYLGTWGGNNYLSLDNSKDAYHWLGKNPYNYRDVGKPYSNDSLTIGNALTVFQANELAGDTSANPNLRCDFVYGVEKYGKGIGLIYKDLFTLSKDPAIGNGRRKGFHAVMECIKYE